MYERTTAVKEKANVGKKREAREKKQREERGEQRRGTKRVGERRRRSTRTYTRAATVSTKTKRNEGRGEEG